jgi:hypothetical protein
MNRIRAIARLTGAAASLAGAVLALSAMAPAASAARTPPFGGLIGHRTPPFGGLIERDSPPPAVHTIVVGGMPGWQITLIAAAAAVFAAALAVTLDRARAPGAAGGRVGPVTWADGSPRAAPGAAITGRGGMLDVLDTFGTPGAGDTGAVSGLRARVLRGGRAH